jgi:hypothetical protein
MKNLKTKEESKNPEEIKKIKEELKNISLELDEIINGVKERSDLFIEKIENLLTDAEKIKEDRDVAVKKIKRLKKLRR